MTELYEALQTQMFEDFANKLRKRTEPISEEEIKKKQQETERFIAELAFRAMEIGDTTFEQELIQATKEHCKFSDVDSLLDSGFINGRSSNHYYFPHLTLREYWTAIHLANAIIENQEVIIHKEGNQVQWIFVKEFIALNKYNPRYSAVWDFVAGILGKKAKSSAIRKGDVKPLEKYFSYVLDEPRDLLGFYDARFARLVNEADVSEDVKGVQQFVDNFDAYMRGKALVRGKLYGLKTPPEMDVLYQSFPMTNAFLEKLIDQLSNQREFFDSDNILTILTEEDYSLGGFAYDLILRVIYIGRRLPRKAIQALVQKWITDENKFLSNKVETLLGELSNRGHFFPEFIKKQVELCLSRTDADVPLSVTTQIDNLADKCQMDSEEVIKNIIGLFQQFPILTLVIITRFETLNSSFKLILQGIYSMTWTKLTHNDVQFLIE